MGGGGFPGLVGKLGGKQAIRDHRWGVGPSTPRTVAVRSRENTAPHLEGVTEGAEMPLLTWGQDGGPCHQPRGVLCPAERQQRVGPRLRPQPHGGDQGAHAIPWR